MLWDKDLKGVFWWNKFRSAGNPYRGSPGLTGLSERARRHASIDAKSRKLLVYVQHRQKILIVDGGRGCPVV